MYGVSRSASNRGAPNPFGCANTVPAHAERSMSDARGPTLGKSGPSVLSRLRPKRPQELFVDFCLEEPHAKRDRQSKDSRFAWGPSANLQKTHALTRIGLTPPPTSFQDVTAHERCNSSVPLSAEILVTRPEDRCVSTSISPFDKPVC